MAAKHLSFSATIASAQLWLVWRSLVHFGTPQQLGEIPVVLCNQFAAYFAGKIDQIPLDSGLELQNLDTPNAPFGPVLGMSFCPFHPRMWTGLLGGVQPATSILNLCPSWRIKEAS